LFVALADFRRPVRSSDSFVLFHRPFEQFPLLNPCFCHTWLFFRDDSITPCSTRFFPLSSVQP